MGGSLIERRRVEEEGLRSVNSFLSGTSPALLGYDKNNTLQCRVRLELVIIMWCLDYLEWSYGAVKFCYFFHNQIVRVVVSQY